jgi:signal peptidase II
MIPQSYTDQAGGKHRYLIIAGLALLLDQLSKFGVAVALRHQSEVDLIRGLVSLSYTENSGIAFGMLSNGDVKWLLVAISFLAIGVVVYYGVKTPASNRLLLWSLALLGAGITGNLIDRVRMGRVIDFIDVYYKSYHWPVFNVADTAITIGAGLMAIQLFLGQPTETRPSEETPAAGVGSSE